MDHEGHKQRSKVRSEDLKLGDVLSVPLRLRRVNGDKYVFQFRTNGKGWCGGLAFPEELLNKLDCTYLRSVPTTLEEKE